MQTLEENYYKELKEIEGRGKKEVEALQERNKGLERELEREKEEGMKLGSYSMQLSEGLKSKTREIEERDRELSAKEEEIGELQGEIERLGG